MKCRLLIVVASLVVEPGFQGRPASAAVVYGLSYSAARGIQPVSPAWVGGF